MSYLKHIILACLLICSLLVQAQISEAEENTDLKHTIGLNATGFLTQLFDEDSGRNDEHLPYLFTYAYRPGRMLFRMGIGPHYAKRTTEHEGFTDVDEITELDIYGRLGIGWYLLSESKWDVLAGLDLTASYEKDQESNDTGFDKITDEFERTAFGGGPFIQVAFRLNKRISLATESALYVNSFEETQTRIFKNFPDFNDELSKSTGTELEIFLPTSLFLQFHF